MKFLFSHIVVYTLTVFVAFGASAQTTQLILDREFAKATRAFASKDYVTAAQIFKELSEQDDFNSQYNYALLLQKGVGTPKDLKQALYWAGRARINGLDHAIELTTDIAELLSNKELEEAQSKLLKAPVERNCQPQVGWMCARIHRYILIHREVKPNQIQRGGGRVL